MGLQSGMSNLISLCILFMLKVEDIAKCQKKATVALFLSILRAPKSCINNIFELESFKCHINPLQATNLLVSHCINN